MSDFESDPSRDLPTPADVPTPTEPHIDEPGETPPAEVPDRRPEDEPDIKLPEQPSRDDPMESPDRETPVEEAPDERLPGREDRRYAD